MLLADGIEFFELIRSRSPVNSFCCCCCCFCSFSMIIIVLSNESILPAKILNLPIARIPLATSSRSLFVVSPETSRLETGCAQSGSWGLSTSRNSIDSFNKNRITSLSTFLSFLGTFKKDTHFSFSYSMVRLNDSYSALSRFSLLGDALASNCAYTCSLLLFRLSLKLLSFN